MLSKARIGPITTNESLWGKKKKPTGSDESAANQTSQSQNSAANLPVEPDKPKE
jgi:hypothetical protein